MCMHHSEHGRASSSYLHLRMQFLKWFYAGQFTGTEGYLEAIAGGLWAGINVARLLGGEKLIPLPEESMLGGLVTYIENSQWG